MLSIAKRALAALPRRAARAATTPARLASTPPRTPAARRGYTTGGAGQTQPDLTPIDPVGPLLAVVGCVAGVVGGVFAYVYVTDTRASVYKWAVMPFIHAAYDPEEGHRLSIWAAKHGLVPRERTTDDSVLHVEVRVHGRRCFHRFAMLTCEDLGRQLWGKKITNPLGLAAGYDKHAEAVDALFGFGFGMVEIGSVTPKPQPGNPKPRMFRLPQDEAVINRYGFNSEGHEAVARRLQARIRKFLHKHGSVLADTLSPLAWLSAADDVKNAAPGDAVRRRSLHNDRLLGVNLGKNKISPADSDADYIDGVAALGTYADYLVINISSPNTPGLRALQRREPIERLLRDAKRARDALAHRPPLVVKIAPDLSDDEIDDIAAVVESVGVDGVIISNTTVSRPDSLHADAKLKREFGGLSGAPVLPLSLRVVSEFYKKTGGRVPIIGCGGIRTGEDALRFARAGASVVQVYTALGYQGPGLVHDIKSDVTERLKKMGKTWSHVVGADHQGKL
nr:Dihydroorotate dehydrogenase (quinone), mitochondrial [Polyrhizophydium stewartii]